MGMDQKTYERAKDLGRQARRAGKKPVTNPYRRGTSDEQYDAWVLGYAEADSEMRARR